MAKWVNYKASQKANTLVIAQLETSQQEKVTENR